MMTAVTPATDDHLLMALGRSLRRVYRRFSLPFPRAVTLGIISFGVLPLWQLPRRFRYFVLYEQQSFSYLLKWMEGRGVDTSKLHESLARLETMRWVRAVNWALAGVVALLLLWVLGMDLEWRRVVGSTYVTVWTLRAANGHTSWEIFIAWNALLTAGFALQWIAVRRYFAAQTRFISVLSGTIEPEHKTIGQPDLRLGWRLGWIAVGIVLLTFGAIWGPALALAGAAQRRYVNVAARRVKERIAARLEQTAGQQT